ncbi:MAG: DUF4291 domain-containing protein [Planctomycetes bacterium]|nr:DUF4291 domain-containing protein [Planctomycetota bacterium]
MNLEWKPYLEVRQQWPNQGRTILASYNEHHIVVYQAYRHEIADIAIARQRFEAPFSMQRMSWIKPNFLWMMHRCGWGTKPDQQRVLAVHLPRVAFELIVSQAVWSSFQTDLHASRDEWHAEVQRSDVRLQWDPDHAPDGAPLERRAIQLGLRGEVLRQYALEWPVRIEDVSHMVQKQHPQIAYEFRLEVPNERTFPITDPIIRGRLKLEEP